MPDPDKPLGPDGFPLNPISAGSGTPAQPAAAASGTVAAAAPAPANKPRFVNATDKTVPLADPIACDARVYDAITVTKLTIGAYRAHVETNGSSDILGLPMYRDSSGEPVPIEILLAVSVPDAQAITEAANDFLNGPPKVGTAPGSA